MRQRHSIPTTELVNEQPAGEVKMFYRSGKNYYTVDGTNFQTDDQHGLMKVVFDPDGKTVWFKEIMMDLAGYNSWVKGTYNEDKTKINVELGQTVGDLSQYNQYLLLYMFNTMRRARPLSSTRPKSSLK